MHARYHAPFPARAAACLVFAASACALARAQEQAGASVLVEEDRIDLLEPAKQVVAYQRLKQKLQATQTAASTAASARLVRKLALATKRADAKDASFAERIALCRDAVDIGEMHLALNDPKRALAWEAIADRIEQRNQWSRVLHNRVNDWFAKRLDAALEAGDWDVARAVLDEWKATLPGDRAVDDGVRTYASHRWEDLSSVLVKQGPRPVFVAAIEEEGRFPGLGAWKRLRAEAAAALQKPFDAAISERDTKRAETALANQKELAGEFDLGDELAPLSANAERLEDLVIALQPSPIERPFGAVRAPALRLEIAADVGDSEFAQTGSSIAASTPMLNALIEYRRYGGDKSRWWFGGSVHGLFGDTSDDTGSATATLLEGHLLLGKRGKRSSGWFGVGVSQSDNEYTLPATVTSGSGQVIGDVRFGAERAMNDKASLYADGHFGQAPGVISWSAAAGLRYFATPNLCLGLRASASAAEWDDSGVSQVDFDASGIGVSVMMQY